MHNPEVAEQAKRLGVPLASGEIPSAIARLVELVVELQARISAVETKKK